MNAYWNRIYAMSAQETNDRLRVRKDSGTDWCEVQMTTNNSPNGSIQIRSKEMAEQLHFMLGQMLDITKGN